MFKIVESSKAPKAIGPYSQAIVHQGTVYCSGCIPLDPAKMEIVGTDIESQTTQAIQNLSAVLNEAGSSLQHVLKTTVFLKNMNDFTKMNEVYGKFFGSHKPARSTVEVARLPKDVLFEIECIAAQNQ